MTKNYPSKVSAGLVVLISCIIGGTMLPALWLNVPPLPLLLITMLVLLGVLYPMFHINYTICGKELTVNCCFLMHQAYLIEDIRMIKDTQSFLSAPAASLDRIAIFFKNNRTPLVISPRNKADFICVLLNINPHIDCKVEV